MRKHGDRRVMMMTRRENGGNENEFKKMIYDMTEE